MGPAREVSALLSGRFALAAGLFSRRDGSVFVNVPNETDAEKPETRVVLARRREEGSKSRVYQQRRALSRGRVGALRRRFEVNYGKEIFRTRSRESDCPVVLYGSLRPWQERERPGGEPGLVTAG